MNTQQAFATLLQQIERAIQENHARYDEADRQADFDQAEIEFERQESLLNARNQLEILQDLWPKLVGQSIFLNEPQNNPLPPVRCIEIIKPSSAGNRSRPPGCQTPEREFWLPILMVLAENGGSASVAEVFEGVEALMANRFNEFDRQLLKNGELRWHAATHHARYALKQHGFIAAQSPYGYWEITRQGRDYLHAESGKKIDSQIQLSFIYEE